MYDLNDAQPQMGPIGELIPDGTFAKIKMAIRPGGVNGSPPSSCRHWAACFGFCRIIATLAPGN